ncbi:MAG: hypothetical protein B6D63_04340 [Candidatus Latescibacteria bacterium 4484_7]|nr:MAG: hypothetical protein B6D63_04340 [Candidatus Latescibacteria bacterium 4484_7]
MARATRHLLTPGLFAVISIFAFGCSTTTYVRPAPPPLRVEIKPARPHRKAVWIRGHWRWAGRRRGWVWVPGHWKIVRR